VDAEAALRRALDTVGCLTVAQAVRLTGEPPLRVTRLLEGWVQAGTALRYREAFWHPAAGRRAVAHRLLVAEIYVALACLDPAWRLGPGRGDPYRPDLWLVEADGARRVAVEADRGTERQPAWADKIGRMRRAEPDGVLVVAASPTIESRLRRQWANRWPCPAQVTALAKLDPDALRTWLDALPPPGPPPPRSARPARRYEVYPDHTVYSADAGPSLPAGAGVERLAGVDRIHWPIDKSRQLSGWFGRIRRLGRGR
jgi:hypothetical protein